MRIGKTVDIPFKMNNIEIEDAEVFCYLGSLLTKDGGAMHDIT